MQTDTSKLSWGAFCNGVSTGKKWLGNEENLYINVLELMSAKFSILTFTKGQSNIVIHLQIDSKTALSHLFQMGITHNRELSHIS